MPELMSVARVAKVLELSTKRVYQLIETGKLESLRPSPRCIRVTRESLDRYIQEGVEKERSERALDLPRRTVRNSPTRW